LGPSFARTGQNATARSGCRVVYREQKIREAIDIIVAEPYWKWDRRIARNM
jgi:uncharacterized protein YciI